MHERRRWFFSTLTEHDCIESYLKWDIKTREIVRRIWQTSRRRGYKIKNYDSIRNEDHFSLGFGSYGHRGCNQHKNRRYNVTTQTVSKCLNPSYTVSNRCNSTQCRWRRKEEITWDSRCRSFGSFMLYRNRRKIDLYPNHQFEPRPLSLCLYFYFGLTFYFRTSRKNRFSFPYDLLLQQWVFLNSWNGIPTPV